MADRIEWTFFSPGKYDKLMRRALPTVMALIGVLLVAFGLPGAWLAQNVVDSQGFVKLSQPLAAEPQFRNLLIAEGVDYAVTQSQVPEQFAPTLRNIVSGAARGIGNWEEFPETFDRTIESSHKALYPVNPQDQPRAALDLMPMTVMLANRASPDLLDASQQTPYYKELSNQDVTPAVNLSRSLAQAGLPLLVGGGLLIALAVAIAKNRGTIMIVSGITGLLVTGLHWIAAPVASVVLQNLTSGNSLAEAFLSSFMPIVTSSIQTWVAVEFVVFAAMLVIGIAFALVFRKAKSRTRTSAQGTNQRLSSL